MTRISDSSKAYPVGNPEDAGNLPQPATAYQKRIADVANEAHSYLRTVLQNSSNSSAIDLEASWFDPTKVLAINKDEFNTLIKRVNVFVNNEKVENFDQIQDLHVKDYIKNIYQKLGSGCCGETANNLEYILIGRITEAEKMTTSDMGSFINELSDRAEIDAGPWYCKASLGSHAFLIEFVDQKFTIHQSFFGSYSLAEDMSKNHFFDKDQFLTDLNNSYSKDVPLDQRVRSCTNLFGTSGIGTGEQVNYCFEENASIDVTTTTKRITQLADKFAKEWSACADKEMNDFVYEKEVDKASPDRAELDDLTLNKLCFGGFHNLINDDFDDVSGVDELEIGRTYYFKKYGADEYTYVGKQDGKHVFEKS